MSDVREEIEKLIEEGTSIETPPHRLADVLVRLAGYYSYLTDQFDVLTKPYHKEWLEVRDQEDVKSDTKAHNIMEMKEIGVTRTRLRHRLKAIEKVMSAIKARMRMKEEELRSNL